MSLELGGAGVASAPNMDGYQVVCTLAEGHYFYGVAALVNSLVRAGFAGIFTVGYRGSAPAWLSQFKHDIASDSYAITDLLFLKFVEVPGPWHLNNCKPRFIRQVLFDIHKEAALVYYFDTDIVLRHPWQKLVDWAQGGVVTVLDVADTYMSPHHAYRTQWRALAAKQGYNCRDFTGYVNGGCVGISRAYATFADVWSGLMDELEAGGANMTKMKNSDLKLEFARMDQDVLNATIMATNSPIVLLGPEAMGSYPWVGEIMPHAMFHAKPWVRRYVLDALRGFPPSRVHCAFWQYVDGPIKPFTSAQLLLKRLQLRIALVIGLVHSRSYRDL